MSDDLNENSASTPPGEAAAACGKKTKIGVYAGPFGLKLALGLTQIE